MATAPLDLDPLLEEEAKRWTAVGYRIETRLPGQIVLIKGKPVNHVLHLLLSIITLGVWLIVWLLVAMLGGEKRRVIFIDRRGLVATRKA